MKTVSVNNTSPDLYYGLTYVGTTGPKSKALLIRSEYAGGKFVWACRSEIHNGNHVLGKKETLREAVQDALNSECEVFEFPNYQSLFKWLAQ